MRTKDRKIHEPYPWSAWFAKSSFVITRQEYSGMPHSFAQQIRNWAVRFNVTVSLRIHPDGTIEGEVKPRTGQGGHDVFE